MACVNWLKIAAAGDDGGADFDDLADFADFYWKYLGNLEVQTTECNDLPGFSDYHKMLKSFIKAQANGPDTDANSPKPPPAEVEADYSYIKVVNWLKSQEEHQQQLQQQHHNQQPAPIAIGQHRFSGVQQWLDHHNCEDCDDHNNDVHYACVDIHERSSQTTAAMTVVEPSSQRRRQSNASAASRAVSTTTSTAADSNTKSLYSSSWQPVRSGSISSSSWEVTRKPRITSCPSNWV